MKCDNIFEQGISESRLHARFIGFRELTHVDFTIRKYFIGIYKHADLPRSG